MIKNRIIIIPTTTDIDNICDYLLQTAQILARHNQVYLYLIDKGRSVREIVTQPKSFRFIKTTANIHYVTPIYLLPYKRFPVIETLNSILSLHLFKWYFTLKDIFNRHKPILWFYHPQLYKYLINFPKRQFFWLYDIVDYHSSPDETERLKIHHQENWIIKNADLTVVNSHVLYDLHHHLTKNIHHVPLGFRKKAFLKSSPKTIKFDYKPPIIGFVGHINSRIDFKLIIPVIKHNPQWQFVFVGPIAHDPNITKGKFFQKINQLLTLPNCHWIDRQPKSHMAGIIRQFDVALIPYSTKYHFNRYSFPMKVMEYFYMGIPVVATTIKELESYPKYVKLGSTSDQFQDHIHHLLSTRWSHQQSQRLIAISHTWEKKLASISKLIINTEKTI